MKRKGLEFISLGLAFGVILWVVDAFLDYIMFYYLYNSFWDVLFLDMPPRAGLHRALAIAFFVCFGLIVARYTEQVEKQQASLTEDH